MSPIPASKSGEADQEEAGEEAMEEEVEKEEEEGEGVDPTLLGDLHHTVSSTILITISTFHQKPFSPTPLSAAAETTNQRGILPSHSLTFIIQRCIWQKHQDFIVGDRFPISWGW